MHTLGPIRRTLGAALLALSAGSAAARADTPVSNAPVVTAPAAATPAPPANVPTYGPPISGVCVFSRDVALNTSDAGVGVNKQLATLYQTAQSELNGVRDALAKDNKALFAEKAKLSNAKFQKRLAALQQRAQDYNATLQTRNAQFTQTRAKAMDQIAAAVTPILVDAITTHKCALIVERATIYGANPAMDLTADVIKQLNIAMPTLTVRLLPPEALQGQH
jgi:Skp family chaperone for outer membrane proteins